MTRQRQTSRFDCDLANQARAAQPSSCLDVKNHSFSIAPPTRQHRGELRCPKTPSSYLMMPCQLSCLTSSHVYYLHRRVTTFCLQSATPTPQHYLTGKNKQTRRPKIHSPHACCITKKVCPNDDVHRCCCCC